MFAGLSSEKYNDYKCNELVAESNRLCESFAPQIEDVRRTGIQQFDNNSEIIVWLDRVCSFISTLDTSVHESFVSMPTFRKNYMKLASVVEFVVRIQDDLSTTKQESECRSSAIKQAVLSMLRKIETSDIAGGAIGSNRSFDELFDLLEIVFSSQLQHIRESLSIASVSTDREIANSIKISIFLTHSCRALESIVEAQSNQKKVFQQFTSRLLCPCLALLDYASHIPTAIQTSLSNLIGKCLFHDQKELEEIASVHFTGSIEAMNLNSEDSNKKRKSAKPGNGVGSTANSNQSYIAAVYSTLGQYCALHSASDKIEFESFSTTRCHGMGALLSTYAQWSLKLCNSSTTVGSKRKQGEAHGTSNVGIATGDAQSWRKHSQRVMHLCFELIAMIDYCCLGLSSVAEGSKTNADMSIVNYVWGLYARNELLETMHKMLPGTITQHKSTLVFINKLKSLSRCCFDVLRINDGNKMDSMQQQMTRSDRPAKKIRLVNVGIPLEQQQQLFLLHWKQIRFVGKMSYYATTAILECLGVLMKIDHRSVLESMDQVNIVHTAAATAAATTTIVVNTNEDVTKTTTKKRKTGSIDDDIVKTETETEIVGDDSEDMASKAIARNASDETMTAWAESGTRCLVQVLVECIFATSGVCMLIFNKNQSASSHEHYGGATMTADNELIQETQNELLVSDKALTDARLSLLKLLVDVYSDLRR